MANEIEKLTGCIKNRNSTIRDLEASNLTYGLQLVQLENELAELQERFDKLSRHVSGESACDCSDWESAGSDPMTGDKYKRCNVCGEVGVR